MISYLLIFPLLVAGEKYLMVKWVVADTTYIADAAPLVNDLLSSCDSFLMRY